MGAWDIGIFDDDSAYDALDELYNSDLRDYINSSFSYAKTVSYLEYDDCFRVLVSSAVIDSIINETKYLLEDEEYENFIKNISNNEISDLKSEAIKSLEIVLSDKSELKELWQENKKDYSKWEKNIRDLIKRLSVGYK